MELATGGAQHRVVRDFLLQRVTERVDSGRPCAAPDDHAGREEALDASDELVRVETAHGLEETRRRLATEDRQDPEDVGFRSEPVDTRHERVAQGGRHGWIGVGRAREDEMCEFLGEQRHALGS